MQRFFAQMRAGNIEEMRSVERCGNRRGRGNGALELKNWILALAALRPFTAQQLCLRAGARVAHRMAIFAVTPHD